MSGAVVSQRATMLVAGAGGTGRLGRVRDRPVRVGCLRGSRQTSAQ
jgi:hypothetical protein